MILLTKLDNRRILVSLESVKYIESIPDSLIVFLNGESVIVKETLDDIGQAILKYKADVLHRAAH